jgi:two-component system response regulator YesN
LLVVEDSDAFADAVVALVEAQPEGWRVVGRARDGREALRLVSDLRPDLVLSDIEMSVMDGVELVRRLSADRDAPPVIVVSGSDYGERALEARFAGAIDYVRKSRVAEDLPAAIKVALADLD